MAQLIKVIQVKKTGGFGDNYNDYATFKELLPSLFGKPIELNGWKYEGVEIKTLRSNPESWYGHRLLGVQLTVGEYRNRTFRRVMIKDDFIDVEDFQNKFNEMKEIAKEVNHNPKDLYPYPISLRAYNTESVRIDAKVSGEQLTAVEKIMGKQQLELELIVPVEKAVEVYKIMFDDSKIKGEE